MKLNEKPLYCPGCNSESVTVHMEGGYRILHCDDCDEDFDLDQFESNDGEEFEDVDESELDIDDDLADDLDDINDDEYEEI